MTSSTPSLATATAELVEAATQFDAAMSRWWRLSPDEGAAVARRWWLARRDFQAAILEPVGAAS